ncbi:MAG TPA: hypothetical protein VMW65_17680, partial [Chloroflexota bacterium]|nr:hypothetical protein [Chloroflexota bacterium]
MLSESDVKALKHAFGLWPERLNLYGHSEKEPGFTRRLEVDGAVLCRQIEAGILEVSRIRRFLVDVAHWKMPGKQKLIEDVTQNEDQTIGEVFRRIGAVQTDRERISACTELSGFGRYTRSTKMASAILRFLWPKDYGVIDWRNYAVLSNFEHQFVSEAFLPPLPVAGDRDK